MEHAMNIAHMRTLKGKKPTDVPDSDEVLRIAREYLDFLNANN